MDFADDVILIFENAVKFNGEASEFGRAAFTLKKLFTQKYQNSTWIPPIPQKPVVKVNLASYLTQNKKRKLEDTTALQHFSLEQKKGLATKMAFLTSKQLVELFEKFFKKKIENVRNSQLQLQPF